MGSRWADPSYPANRDASPADPRDAHARRTAGRPRRVVYAEAEDVPPAEVCYCHGAAMCPDYLAAMYDEARDPTPYRDGEPWP